MNTEAERRGTLGLCSQPPAHRSRLAQGLGTTDPYKGPMRPTCTPPRYPIHATSAAPVALSDNYLPVAMHCPTHLDSASLRIPNTLSRHISGEVNISLSKLCKHPVQVSAEVLNHSLP